MPISNEDIRSMDVQHLEHLEGDRSLSDSEWRVVVAELARRGIVSTERPSTALLISDRIVAAGPPAAPAPIQTQGSADVSYSCPRCRSESTQLVSMAHSEGLTHLSGGMSLGTLGRGPGGSFAAGSAGVFHGTSLTDLSAKLSPPVERGPQSAIAVMVATWFVVFVLVAIWRADVAFVAAGIIAVFAFRSARQPSLQWNREQLPLLLDRWRRAFVCKRCSEIFDPTARLG